MQEQSAPDFAERNLHYNRCVPRLARLQAQGVNPRKMQNLLATGRLLFALAMASFGVHFLIYATGATGTAPGPPWTASRPLWAYCWGVGLILAALSIVTKQRAGWAASLLGIALLLQAVLVYLPRLAANLHNPAPWTSGFEMLALCGGAMVLAGTAEDEIFHSNSERGGPGRTTLLGQYLYAIPLVVFGTQHFLYGRFIATLIPAWIPGHLLWAYFVGVAFVATALAIIFRTAAALATAMLGLMFFLWVVLLHLPRVVTSPHNGNEWTSAIVALAMSGSAYAISGSAAIRD
jgi:hypothetical protein